jgi:hypothetical protein
MNRSTVRALLLAAALGAVTAPAASAASDGPSARLKAQVEIDRFIVGKDGVRALGYATTDVGRFHKTRRVKLRVKKTSLCSVIDVSIKRLDLKLLGLNLSTSAINLQVKGNPHRSLGRLFCRLSRRISLNGAGTRGTRSVVRSLNRRLESRKMPTVGFSGTVTRQQTQSEYAPCEVLDLVIGPIHIDLIGLIVDLYGPTKNDPVTAIVTADPNRGVLGEKFCELAGGPQV